MDSKRAIEEFNAIKKYSDKTNMRLAAEGWDKRWKILIAVILSAQTRDETTIRIAERLFERFGSLGGIAEAKINDIEDVIKSINYYKTKAKNIKGFCERVSKNGIPKSVEELIKLPGVGRKTANVFLSEINKVSAIAVDTHVFRISRKMGWSKANNPQKVEKDLEILFPKSYWNKINPNLVRFGKGYGTSRKKEDEILEKIKEKRG